MNLARFAHSYANLRSVNLAGQKSACEGPADVECRPHAARPDPRGVIRNRRMAPIAPSNNAWQFETPARCQPQYFIPLLLQQLPAGGIRTRAPWCRKPFSGVNRLKVPGVRPLFELATQLIKILYGLV